MTFLDTNILLYTVATAPEEDQKRSVARSILRQDDIALSVQVLQEFYVQATLASRSDPFSHEEASALIGHWLRFHTVSLTVAVLNEALQIKSRYAISYWDAAIIAAASTAKCPVLYSEDLNHNQVFGGVKVINPFFGST